jgi:hypothetical protein
MKTNFFISLFIVASSLQAFEVDTKIQDLLIPHGPDSDYKILSKEDGRIYWINQSNPELIEKILKAKKENLNVTLDLDADENVQDVILRETPVAPVFASFDSAKGLFNSNLDGFNFTSTDVNETDAKILFDSLNSRTGNFWGTSQCFNRALIWSHDMSILRNMNPRVVAKNPSAEIKYNDLRARHTGIKSMKAFLFFSKKYIDLCDDRKGCKWWFHVAPYVKSGDKELVLDREFMKTPQELQAWATSWSFVGKFEEKTGIDITSCPIIAKYQEYENADAEFTSYSAAMTERYKDEDVAREQLIRENRGFNKFCMIRKVPMYYYDPHSIEYFDKGQVPERNSFNEDDIKAALKHFKDTYDW